MKTIVEKVLVLVLVALALPAFANSTPPKNEMRSAWLTTVWGIDWPSTQGATASAQAAQKKEMIKILDSLAVNNFNAVNFQVRSMSDAMYKSTLEPWSSWLTGTRGLDPGWDPLAFVVEECHKRGMECHAWVNPYRFASESSTWASGGDGTGYVENGWIINAASNTKILNPGKPEVIEHLVKVIEEIVTGYDIDGLLFDDYYYNSAASGTDAGDYNAYTAAGGTLSKGDWRRNNVHTFIKKLYEMIQKHKPYIRFGQAPPGTTFRSASRAAVYGIDPCPVGYELCYDSQYIDIMKWLQDGIIDYISPQVYWAIGASSDYSQIVPWWSKVVNKFGRHLFVSQTIQYLNGSNSGSGKMTKFDQFNEQILINRNSSLNGSSGSVFYSQKYMNLKQKSQTFGNYLKSDLYRYPALLPAMTWKTQSVDPGQVKNLTYSEGNLVWDSMDNMRYTVYAIPNDIEPSKFNKDVNFLLGVSYSSEYDIPADYSSGYYYAVCAYDRYGKEWDYTLWRIEYENTLAAPTLVSPATSTGFDYALNLTWNAVENAELYAVDIASDSQFLTNRKTLTTGDTYMNVDNFYSSIKKNETTYWRVRSAATGYNDGISEVRSFVYILPELIYPKNEATGVDTKDNFTWTVTTEGAPVTLQIAEDADFEKIIFSEQSTTGNYNIPAYTLQGMHSYYARLLNREGRNTESVYFTTKSLTPGKPVIKTPVNGGTVYANSKLEIYPDEAAEQVAIHVCVSENFTTNTRKGYLETVSGFNWSINASNVEIARNGMVDGTTYYLRAYINYLDSEGALKQSDFSDVVTFVYSSSSSAIASVKEDSDVKIVSGNVIVTAPNEAHVRVAAVSMLGRSHVLYDGQGINEEVSLSGLSDGIYVIQVVVNGDVHSIKYIKK